MKRTGLVLLIGAIMAVHCVVLIHFEYIKSLINQQHSSFASFKPKLKDVVSNYIKALKTPGEDIFWSLLSDIESLLNVYGSFLSSGEMAKW